MYNFQAVRRYGSKLTAPRRKAIKKERVDIKMKWIELNDGSLLNLEKVVSIDIFCYESQLADIIYMQAPMNVCEHFQTLEEAKERLDNLKKLLLAD